MKMRVLDKHFKSLGTPPVDIKEVSTFNISFEEEDPKEPSNTPILDCLLKDEGNSIRGEGSIRDDEDSEADEIGEMSGNKLPHEGKLLFLSCIAEDKQKVLYGSVAEKKKAWEVIEKKMLEKKYRLTPAQLKRVLRNLKRTYKEIKDSQRATGRGRKTWVYYTKMDDIFGRCPAVSPPFVNDSITAMESSPMPDLPITPNLPATAVPSTSKGTAERSLPPNEDQTPPGGKRKRKRDDREDERLKVLKDLADREKELVGAVKETSASIKSIADSFKELVRKF